VLDFSTNIIAYNKNIQ